MGLQINLSIPYEGKIIRSSLDIESEELFTRLSWVELYNRASTCAPYYVAVAILVRPREDAVFCKLYDGSSFYKYHKNDELDPETRLNILKTQYLFIKCLEFTELEDGRKGLPLEVSSSIDWKHKAILVELAEDPEYSDLLFDSLNAAAYCEANANGITQLARTQFIIGKKILDCSFNAGIRWVWCAAQLNLVDARVALGIFALNLSGSSSLFSDIDEAMHWLELAEEQECRPSVAGLLSQLRSISNT